ncbi:hypothetical protein OHZ10_33260 [Burkholderia arboris]|uniref:F-box domain-containing protein n=1 Tax=Burkholderia arboris TaxID=488730 RepID=A0ABZ3DXT8_9BURK
MPTSVDSKSSPPILPSQVDDGSEADQRVKSGGATHASPHGPLGGLTRYKANLAGLPAEIHQAIAGQLPMADLSRLSRTARTLHERLGGEVRAFASLRKEIDDTSDLAGLHRLTSRVAAEVVGEGKPAIRRSHAGERQPLFFVIGERMYVALKHIVDMPPEQRAGMPPEQLAAQFGQYIAGFSQMRPPELAEAGVYYAAASIVNALPRGAQQAVFDRALAAARAFPPEYRSRILIALTEATFRSPDPVSADSLRDARTNTITLANSTDGMAPAQLKPIVERLANHSKLFLMASEGGDWQSPFNAIVDASSRLAPDDRQAVGTLLNDSLDKIESNIDPAGIDAARQRLAMLTPPAA